MKMEEETGKLNGIIMLETMLEIPRARLGNFVCKQNGWGNRKESYNRQHC